MDGGAVGTGINAFSFETGSENSLVEGLVVGNFSEGIAFRMATSNITIQGNYIGTNPTGTASNPNEIGVSHRGTSGTGQGALIGGLNPEDRNIISGNTDGSAAAASYPSTDWVIQGNYIGVGADGVTAIPNSSTGGSGALSIDDCSDALVGGTSIGAANVISGNTSYGLAPHNSPGLVIQGNLIGTDWTGEVALPNQKIGVIISGDQTGSVIGGTTASARNIISGNIISGVLGATTGELQIQGNYIGLDVDGEEAIPNGSGILTGGEDEIIGGSEANRNVISGNTLFNVSVQGMQTPSSGVRVSGNYIGTNASGNIDPAITAVQGEGVRISANTSGNLIGGEAGNLIAGNRGAGVSVRSLTITQFSVTATPAKNAILGNQIYNNGSGGPITGAPGLGIDHYRATVASIGSFPVDAQADSYVDLGINANDISDPDTGPNNYINFPVLNSVSQTGTQASINFNLDAADSPSDQYRVEFFANDTADPSGYGEGQTFLGYTTVSNGNNQVANLTLPSGLNLANKSISATTTAIDNTTNSGFGGTSEFSALVSVGVSENNTSLSSNDGSTNNSGLAPTGDNSSIYLFLSLAMIVLSIPIYTFKLRTIEH